MLSLKHKKRLCYKKHCILNEVISKGYVILLLITIISLPVLSPILYVALEGYEVITRALVYVIILLIII